MPADPSIYSLIQPQKQQNPLEGYATAMQIRSLLDQGDLHALQRKRLEGDIAEEEGVKKLFATGTPTAEQVYAVSPTRGAAFQKAQQEGLKSRAELMQKDRENFIAFADEARQRLPTITNQEQWNVFRDEQQQKAGMFVTPEMRSVAQKQLQSLPAQFDPNFIRNATVKADELFTPKMVERTDGQRKWMEDVNPVTNPAIRGGASVAMQQTPDALAADKRAREANTTAASTRVGSEVMGLRKEFNDTPEVKNYRSVVPIVNSAVKAPDSRAGDIQFAYTIGKIFDPNSVVREGELKLVGEAATWLQKYEGELRTFFEGKGRLSPKTRQELLETAMTRVNALQAAHDAVKDTYTKAATARNLPLDQIFVDMPKIETPKPRGTASRVPVPGAAANGIKFLGFE